MDSITPDPKNRSYLLPPGCKDLVDVLNGGSSKPMTPSADPVPRVNSKIRAPQVQVVDEQGRQLGIMSLSEALMLAKSSGVDLVETAPLAKLPVCRLVDIGKFRYEQARRRKRND